MATKNSAPQLRPAKRRAITIIAIVVGFGIIGLALLLRSDAAPNPNLTGDLNNDNTVNLTDLSLLLTNWSTTSANADINKDGQVNLTDLSLLLSNWNKTATTPPTTPPPTTPPPSTGGITCDQAGIQQLVNSVSQANLDSSLRRLTQDDTKATPNQSISRHVSSSGNKQKTDWARAQYTSYGLQDVSQSFSSGGYSLVNVVGRLSGSTTPNTIYAVGGHIDSISESPKTLAPGAEDDGSGVVIAMEAARVLAPFKPCLKSTLDFVGFNDEEENMKGSETYVASVKSGSGKTFKAMLNMDMVAYAPNGECVKADANLSADTAITSKLVQMNTKYGINMNITAGRYTVDDIDNSSFWTANLPSTYLVDCATEVNSDKYPNYHSTGDTVTSSNISFTQMTKLTKVLVAALAEYGIQ